MHSVKESDVIGGTLHPSKVRTLRSSDSIYRQCYCSFAKFFHGAQQVSEGIAGALLNVCSWVRTRGTIPYGRDMQSPSARITAENWRLVVFPSSRSSRIFVTTAKYSLTYGPTVRTMPFVVSSHWMIEIY